MLNAVSVDTLAGLGAGSGFKAYFPSNGPQSAAEILGYPLVERPGRIHVAVPTTRALRPSRTRPLTGMRIHREKRIK